MSSTALLERVGRHALRPLDGAWLFAFRVLFGAVLAVSMLRFCAYGWIDRLFVEPRFHFKYFGFEWVEPLSGANMHLLFWGLAALSVAVAAGAAFRLCAAALAAGLTYVQLIDVSTYLNHYYLAALLAWLLCISPANRAWSVDAWLARRSGRRPPQHAATVSTAWLYLFRLQVGLVYVFAGLAKAQSDWLLHAQPLRIWLGASTELPVLGPLFTFTWMPLVMSWCGFLFDTTIVIWLSYRRTRPYAYVACIVFHVLTRVLFPIGMFPVIMVLAAALFFDADWPRGALRHASRALERLRLPVPARLEKALHSPVERALPAQVSRTGWFALGALALYGAVQLSVPLRFLAYGGNVLWHEQGMRFSWRVMVRAKGGSTTFVVRNKQTGRTYHVSPRAYLTGMQESEMSSQPDLILQLAHRIRRDFEQKGLGPVEVRADARVSLNGRRGARLVDPDVDLVAVHDGLGRADWILPAPAQAPPHTRPVL